MREIRVRKRALDEAEAREILARAEYGILASAGADGWPYAVPLNHVLVGDAIYLHCAFEGHKIDNIAHEERVSYCAVASARVLPEKLSTLYESAIVFGRAAVVVDEEEKRRALKLLMERFCGPSAETGARFEEHLRQHENAQVIRIGIERITGKAHRAASA